MTQRVFASWVEPIAGRFAATRLEVADTARQVSSDAWDTASAVEGWRCRDILAHLAEGDVSVQNTIQTVLDHGGTDCRAWNNGREERIAAGLRCGAGLTVEQLIAQVLREGEGTQRLLACLNDEHETVQVITSRTNPAPQGLGEVLAGYHHDEEHLEQLRPAIAEGSAAR
jgi:hypothetical protein